MPLQLESRSQTVPESEKDCHFFKLPAELRLVIYDMVISSIEFQLDEDDEERDGGVKPKERNGGRDGNVSETAGEVKLGISNDKDRSTDVRNQGDGRVIQNDDENDQETHNKTSGNEVKANKSSASDLGHTITKGHLPRLGLLDTNHKFRNEVLPLYNYHVTKLVAHIFNEGKAFMVEKKRMMDRPLNGGTRTLRNSFIAFEVRAFMHRIEDFRKKITRELGEVGEVLGAGTFKGEEAEAELTKAKKEFEKIGEEVIRR